MCFVPIKAALLALILVLAPAASRAGIDVRAVSEQNGRIVVQIDNHRPPNHSPVISFYVAIGPTGTFNADFFGGPAPSLSAGRGASAAAALIDTVTTSTPFAFRGARIIWVKVQIPSNTPVGHVVIDYTPAATVADASTADPLLREVVVNQSVFPIAVTAGAPEGWFSRAAGWAKLSVLDRGMYAVTGSDLAAAGVNLSAIDPVTMRVYTQGGVDQPRLLSDPVGSWAPGNAMREVAVRIEAGSDGTFDPGDRIIFYGLGTRDWADYYDPSAPDSVFHEHTRAKTNFPSFYYLAWGGSLPGAPSRMVDTAVPPVAGGERTTYTHREYRERDLIADFDFRGDGWLWLDIDNPGSSTYSLGIVPLTHLVSSVPQQLLSLGLVPSGAPNLNHHVVFRRGAAVIGDAVWDTQGQSYYENGVPIRIQSNALIEGDNSIGLQLPGDLNPNDEILFAWYAIWYERRIIASGDAVMFSTPDTTGALNLRARAFSATGTLFAFDVTDPWHPQRLIDFETTGTTERSVRLGVDLTGTHRHMWAGTGAGFKKPGVARVNPVDLRAETSPPNMLIVTHRDMRAAADRLRAFRAAGHLPLYANPVVKVVTTDEVYENFSGGMPDAMAIRNYIKYLYDNFKDATGNPRLGYVLLLGDATEDFRNHVSAQPDFVPSNLYFTRNTLYAFSTDEWFGHLDPQDQMPGHGVLDVAIGRLPAASADEASFVVDKLIAYETEAPRDDWRHRGILVADDENSSFVGACETQWTGESEAIARFHAPELLDIQKIYLTEYPDIAGVKPTSRLAFLDAWNAGAMVINYIGHGSSVQMADEQVFLGSDVSQLLNGLRLPIVMAFSCTIGDFANPAGKSLSEKLILRQGGGSIANITASRETYPTPNERICFSMFQYMFPVRPEPTPIPLGVALLKSKIFGQVDTFWQIFQEENNWKYNLIGDPAMRPAVPRQQVRFDVSQPDTLVAGLRHTLRGVVYQDGAPDNDFDGPVSVVVREPQLSRVYRTNCATQEVIAYLLPGGPIYTGTVDAVDGQFQVSFRVPRYAATGPLGSAAAYATDQVTDASTSMDSLLFIAAPTLADSVALTPVDGAPRVDLGFKSGLKVVKPGDTVRGRVADADGINILNTTNEGRQAILIDNLPVPIDVNEFFSFDHGGVDTSGVLLFPLPDLNVGRHRLVYKVSDSFGFTTLDTLQFDVTDEANYYAQAVFNYPNPFQEETKFLFRVSNRASIKLELFTVSGKFVRRIEETRDGGEVWLHWDGRDGAGGDVANGSYLYVATIDFEGVDRPPVVLRGALSRIR